MPARSGGVEKHVENLAVRMAALGHEVTVYSRTGLGSVDETYRGVRIFLVPIIETKYWAALSQSFFGDAARDFPRTLRRYPLPLHWPKRLLDHSASVPSRDTRYRYLS